jgi:hypothetical protein
MLLLLTYAFGGALNTKDIKFIDYIVPGNHPAAVCQSASSTPVEPRSQGATGPGSPLMADR